MPSCLGVVSHLGERGPGRGPTEIAFEAFGVRVLVTTDSRDVIERLPLILPPGATPCPPDGVEHRITVNTDPSGTFGLFTGQVPVLVRVNLEIALMLLDSQIRAQVALHAQNRIFVHAGVVGHGDSAIVIPGGSFTGKTTLVAALVRAGATYFSDEYAVLDEDGLVHPYPKPLSLRGEDLQQVDHPVASLGGTAGEGPLPVRTILVCTYRPGSEWRPSQLSAGQGVLAMLSNTVPARSKPAEALGSIRRAVEGATVLEGDRGDASSIVDQLLAGVSA